MDRSASRPNSSLATPTYMSTVQYKSTQSTLKRTRSNSSIPTEGPKSINNGDKTTASPVNFQLSSHGVSPKEFSNLAATTSLQLDKATSDDISMRNRNKNSTGNRMLSSNGWAGQKKLKANHQLLEHTQSEFQVLVHNMKQNNRFRGIKAQCTQERTKETIAFPKEEIHK